jgi:hypothetical protein
MDLNANSSPICASRSEWRRRYLKAELAAFVLSTVGALCVLPASSPSRGDDACASFRWNVTQERALFATSPQAVTAAPDGDLPPILSLGHLYDLSLSPQEQVHFPQPPGKKSITDGAYGGIARVHVSEAGLYRVALDIPFWIDLVDEGKLVATNDFTGQPGCSAPHKIVQYQLRSGELLLQVSGGSSAHVHLTITRAPDAAAH